MEIWLWILAAWVLSYVALGKKKVAFEHLVWILLPVDMYGIEIAGAVIKPYMIFCVLLLCRMLFKRKTVITIRSRWSLVSGLVIFLCFLVNLVNNQSDSSLKASLLLPIVWACSLLYASEWRKESAQDICDVLLAAGIGYGIVFFAAYLSMELGWNLPGSITSARMDPGIYMRFQNMYDGSLIRGIRLRGFTVDPNTMIGTFLYSTLVAYFRIAGGKGSKKELLAIVLAAFATMQSNSRMGLICFCLITVGAVILGYRVADRRMRNRMKACFLLLGFAAAFLLITTDIFPNFIRSVLARYQNRSGLNDEYGRFTIWREVISVLWEENLFFGIGMGQVQYYTAAGRACHNTWLEIVCAFGIVIGGAAVAHFAMVALKGLRWLWKNRNSHADMFAWAMILGTLGIMLSLLSVDHIAYSYLWFGSTLMAGLANMQVLPPKKENGNKL